ncbi:hypothetical protein K440DRAFT_636773 [Wilcoxina mikolae CBS 423.85]|nr:hypothetical protein K440DRAFT_636773 [Wilcoxina mikolae CBS 423.85]
MSSGNPEDQGIAGNIFGKGSDDSQFTVGKKVYEAWSDVELGKIAHCFDTPSIIMPYPHRYKYDQSLIRGQNFSSLYIPNGCPKLLRTFADVSALAERHIFTMRMNITSQNLDFLAGTCFSVMPEMAICEGAQYN